MDDIYLISKCVFCLNATVDKIKKWKKENKLSLKKCISLYAYDKKYLFLIVHIENTNRYK